ncbi:SDR family NAD(P)-dependent oxidoreductase [Pseudorhodoferax sp.]|uniref:SDR family NAD(P)-dependent oxidoreductase n=1 Tax=Pseudorhodoferax sp. TaxID=1993553 RepID=UPI002DD63E8E|nr:SDR family NAD(P)-dependent oxidoreductase [Pseudorhodoferax sp.]
MQRPVALVTGGASNIGWACAQRFAETHQVLIGDLRPPEQPLPPGMHYCAADITSAASCAALLQHAGRLGPLAAVVHSAAITAPVKPFGEIPEQEWRRVIDVNLTGAFLLAQAALPALRATRGALVFIASRAGRTGYAALIPKPGGTKPHYAASKAALLCLAKSLAVELAPDGVRVNSIVPGSIEGAMLPRELWPELAARIPLGRLGRPEEIAQAAWFLCAPEAGYITGHALDVNGGTWMN